VTSTSPPRPTTQQTNVDGAVPAVSSPTTPVGTACQVEPPLVDRSTAVLVNRQRTAGSGPAPTEIAAAIDALGVLREIAPERKFALASDDELKLRALRNPFSRAKAMQLYGMTLPDGLVAPDLQQLLHTKPGDNCPICRMRAQMPDAGNGL